MVVYMPCNQGGVGVDNKVLALILHIGYIVLCRPCFAIQRTIRTPQENRLLHWTVTHRDDIARSNFLRGDHAHFFTNLDQVST